MAHLYIRIAKHLNIAAIALFLCSVLPSTAWPQVGPLPTTTLIVGGTKAYVEIAATPKTRNQGLMYRLSLPPDHGMLFVFQEDSKQCFWMKNTPLPLSIAFIDQQGRIVNILDMQPHSQADHCSNGPIRYALEMPQGWFRLYEIKPEQKVQGLPVRRVPEQ